MDRPAPEHTGSHAAEREPSSSWEEDLAVIRDQTHESVELLRRLVEMLLPKGDPDAPKLEDLLAALIVQQRETLQLAKQIAAGMSVLLDHALGDHRPRADGRHGGNGTFRG